MQRPEPASTELMKDREVQEAMTDRDAGGARPASDVDALIERLIDDERNDLLGVHAAAALVQLREENARLT